MYMKHLQKWKETGIRRATFPKLLGMLMIQYTPCLSTPPASGFQENDKMFYMENSGAVQILLDTCMRDFSFTWEELAYTLAPTVIKTEDLDAMDVLETDNLVNTILTESIDMFLTYKNHFVHQEEEYYRLLDKISIARQENPITYIHSLSLRKEEPTQKIEKQLVRSMNAAYSPWNVTFQ